VFKDGIVTLDMEAISGSTILLGARPANESTVAGNFRRAGCVVLGKITLTEWQNFRYTNQHTGWTARGGQCTGAFYRNMKASGSSTGSAVATSLGLAFAGEGAEVPSPHFKRLFWTRPADGHGACRQMAVLQPRRKGQHCRAQGDS
jgi:amidase